ncbi:MAG TPA: selenide, water dikinase SelD [Planctomycetaceae bacterium]|nr:selenide, water dikinase SelD [Planctomycetaceae bacterium]
MSSEPALATRDLVLLGIGHTNSHVLRMWMMDPIKNVRLTCVSNYSIATYSGMLPAVLAGQCGPEAMEVDLVRMCSAAGVRLVHEPVKGLDPANRLIRFSDRPPMHYDALSIGVGSVPDLPRCESPLASMGKQKELSAEQDSVELEMRALAIKPMQTFLPRLEQSIDYLVDQRAERTQAEMGPAIDLTVQTGPMRIGVVGSGAAGVEIASCLRGFLAKRGVSEYEISLVSRSREILSGGNPKLVTRTVAELGKRGVAIVNSFEVASYGWSSASNAVHLQGHSGQLQEFDLVIWATGATAPPLLGDLGLVTDDQGFLKVDETLSCVGQTGVFAVGDTASIQDSVPKAGVYAVRQGPILWKNLHRYFAGQQLMRYQPQKGFLKLLNFGDGHTAMEWKGFVTVGRLPWNLKKWIDESFLAKHTPAPMDSEEEMQCSGCGCKLDAISLEASLTTSFDAAGELHADDTLASGSPSGSWFGGQAEDAAEIGGGWLASVDFFTPPVPDPFTSGRLLAVHAASDLLAVGARPHKALATVTVPEAQEKGNAAQSRWLAELLAGIRKELGQSNAVLAGGHTIVGPRAEIGLTVVGRIEGDRVLRKDSARVGDALVLLKPLGTGTIMAAWHRGRCSARDWDNSLATMLIPQDIVLEWLSPYDVHSATDVTGFGLAGHLLEMMTQSGVSAELEMDSIPMLPGAVELCRQGVRSSLYESNRAAASPRCDFIKSTIEHDLLFDPQTCGGLLVSLPSENAQEFVSVARKNGFQAAARIGDVVEQKGEPLILSR